MAKKQQKQQKQDDVKKVIVKNREVHLSEGLALNSVATYDDGEIVKKKAIFADEFIYLTNKNGVIHAIIKRNTNI